MIYINDRAGGKALSKSGSHKSDSSGMVLVVVVIFAAVAAILATGLHLAGGTRITQARQEVRFNKAFYVAEAGVEHAKSELRYRAGNLNGVLTNGGVLFGGLTNYGEGCFDVRVRNNSTEANPWVDTDHIVVIRSTGIVETATRAIEVEIYVTPFTPETADGALSIYGTNTDLDVSGNSKIDGNDWNVPADFAATGSAADGTLSGNPTNPGVFYTSTTTVINVSGSGELEGNPHSTNGVGMYTETDWYEFLDKSIAKATIYTGGSLGTREAPIISMLPTGATEISGKVDGAGILIVPGDANLRISGTFKYEGIVILVGNGTIDAVDEVFQVGTARIFGAVICVGGALDIQATGTADIKYSTQALANLANLQVPAELTVRYWKEIKISSASW